MMTSSYTKAGHLPNAVSIAGKTPEGFTGRTYKQLAPKYHFFKLYKLNGDEEQYKACFQEEVLDQLDPKEVYQDLGEDAILLCYEKPGRFCHRRLVAKWLEDKLGIEVKEL